MEADAAGERVRAGVESQPVPPLACVSARLKATAWVALEVACMSSTSLQGTSGLRCAHR